MIEALLIFVTRALTGVQARWLSDLSSNRQYVFYANHTSNLDALLIWASLPRDMRRQVRPVAAQDYWDRNFARRHVAVKVLNAILINRNKVTRENNPIDRMTEALEGGHSIIIFPEGTRSNTELPITFKSGLYKITQSGKNVPIVPVWIDNAARVLPKGESLPVPIVCGITIGTPIYAEKTMEKSDFLELARNALIQLKVPDYVG